MFFAAHRPCRQQLAIGSHHTVTHHHKPLTACYRAQHTSCRRVAGSSRGNTARKQHSTGPRRVVPVMVEGHQCHRVAHAHRRLLLGKSFVATSPNGRFVEGAAAISGKVLTQIEVVGKNLFYMFSPAPCTNSTAAAQLEPQLPLLQPVDEDPLQPGAFDSDSDDQGPAAAADAAAAAAAAAVAVVSPITPAPRSRRRPSAVSPAAAAAGGPVQQQSTPQRPLLASLGSAALAALTGTPTAPATGSPRHHLAATDMHTPPAATAAADGGIATLAPTTPGNQQAAAAAAGLSGDDGVVVMHIHFGMSGAFRTAALPGPEPTPTTRLRLEHSATGLVAHLSAMTVAHGGLGLYQDKASKLGPDPLRPDADPERFWARVQSSKKPIGLLLMDQTAVAGVGNIYRAEILYKTGLHPEQPGHTLDRATFEVLWGHCVDLLRRGFTSGSILTVDPQDAQLLGKPWTRRYIYNQRQCGRCKGPVKVWDMATRTVYCCETCQPLRLPSAAASTGAPSSPGSSKPTSSKKKGRSRSASTPDPAAPEAAAAGAVGQDPAAVAAQLLHPSRLKSMAAATVAQGFVSHCAPDDPSDLQPSKMTCQQLRDHLRVLNLDTRGNKAALVERLEAAKGWMAAPTPAAAAAAGAGAAGANAAGSGPQQLGVGGSVTAGGSESGDEVDKAEEALAERLSVPPAKRRRRAASTAQQGARRSTAATPAAAGVASATAAAAEKEAAGENRAVEHVALHADEWTEQLMFGPDAADQQQQQQQQQQGGSVQHELVSTTAMKPRRSGRGRQ